MKPWIHYVPFPPNASQGQLSELLAFVRENDAAAQKIAGRGREFVGGRLGMGDVQCYWRALVKTYAKLLTYRPVLREGLIPIKSK